MNKEYQLIVKTNSYAGNFEREMCAFMTGIVGQEDNTGQECVDDVITERFENKISGRNDDNGCFRPVDLDDENSNNFVIFLEEPLLNDDLEFLEIRAKLWEKEKPYEYLDKNFKFLGLEQVEMTTTKKKLKI